MKKELQPRWLDCTLQPMNCRIALTLALLGGFTTNAFAQVVTNVFERVLHLAVVGEDGALQFGTGFTTTVDGRQYLITAKHLVPASGDTGTILVEQNTHFVPLKMGILRCEDPVDIAVLIPPYQLTVDFPLPTEGGQYFYGGDLFFLGFPYNIGGPSVSGGYPLPEVKRALAGILLPIPNVPHAGLLYLDGYNNPGFSGGPVVSRGANSSTFSVVGVIVAFKPDFGPVMTPHIIPSPDKASDKAKKEPWRIEKEKDGSYVEYEDGPQRVALNTGIAIAATIGPAVDLIRKHPGGPIEKSLTVQPQLH